MKRLIFPVIVCLFFSLSCSTSFARKSLHTLQVALSDAPNSLDPQEFDGTWDGCIIGDLFVGLLTENKRGEPIPGVAKSWTISPDGKTYTFALRNTHWSDGTPLTATDFVFAFQRMLAKGTKSKYASLFYPIEGAEEFHTAKVMQDALKITALNDNTLEIKLKSVTPYFLEILTNCCAYPIPAHIVKKYGSKWHKLKNFVCNGPYMPHQWGAQKTLTVVKNPRFYNNDQVFFDKITFHVSEDMLTAQQEFAKGNRDIVVNFATTQIQWLKEHLPQETKLSPNMSTYYYTFNTKRPPFDNKKVRQALSMAIDREAITNILLKTGEIPAYSLVPPGIANYSPPSVAWRKYSLKKRLKKAEKLMKSEGFTRKKPLQLTISYNENLTNKRISRAIASMWYQVGVQSNFAPCPSIKKHYNNLKNGDFSVARAGWTADYNDAQNVLFLMESRNKSFNYGKYTNKKFDLLMRQTETTVNPAKRAKIMQKAERITMDEMPNIPIFYFVSKNLVAQDIKGFVDNPRNVHRWRYLSRRK